MTSYVRDEGVLPSGQAGHLHDLRDVAERLRDWSRLGGLGSQVDALLKGRFERMCEEKSSIEGLPDPLAQGLSPRQSRRFLTGRGRGARRAAAGAGVCAWTGPRR